jgi:hypothetical protein
MRLGYTLLAIVFACSAVTAQELQSKSETKVKVEDGRTITVTGCVGRTPSGGYMLTDVSGKGGAYGNYILVASDDNNLHGFDKAVGTRVEVTGKAADQGNGKLKVETKTEGTTGKTESKSEVKGNLEGLPYFGVKEYRSIASVCR